MSELNLSKQAFKQVSGQLETHLTAQHSEFAALFAGLAPVDELRRQAKIQFENLGLPTRKSELWMYTPVQKFLQEVSPAMPVAALKAENKKSVSTELQAQIEALRSETFMSLVFIDGIFSETFSDPFEFARGISLAAPAQGLYQSAEAVQFLEQIDGRLKQSKVERKEFEYLNHAHLAQGAFIRIHKEHSFKTPVHLIYVFTDASAESLVAEGYHFKNLISVEAGAKAHVLESYVHWKTKPHFVNTSTDILLSENATLDYVRTQSGGELAVNIGHTRAFAEKNSSLHTLSYTSGAKLSRHNHDVYLVGVGAKASVDGVYLSHGKQHVDHHTTIVHELGETTSSQVYKGLLAGSSRAVFNGSLKIKQHAQKSDAEQLNKNLLLSKSTEIDTKPELEIEADDVKAKHGSTVGRLSDEEIFYFQSRSIKKSDAVAMLSKAFLQEIIFKLQNPLLRQYLTTMLDQDYAMVKESET